MKTVVKFGGSSLASARPVSYTHLQGQATQEVRATDRLMDRISRQAPAQDRILHIIQA